MRRVSFFLLAIGVAGCAQALGTASSVPAPSTPGPTALAQAAGLQLLGLLGAGHVYYPQTWQKSPPYAGGSDTAIAVISSSPVAPCATPSCQNYAVAANGVVLEFRYSTYRPGQPTQDWTNANDSVGGQPAFREDWGPVNAHDADEGHTWRVRMPNGILAIYASLMGPDLASGRAALQQILASFVVTP
jgi:hypothetical protein